mgnify:CR=1 FL=1
MLDYIHWMASLANWCMHEVESNAAGIHLSRVGFAPDWEQSQSHIPSSPQLMTFHSTCHGLCRFRGVFHVPPPFPPPFPPRVCVGVVSTPGMSSTPGFNHPHHQRYKYPGLSSTPCQVVTVTPVVHTLSFTRSVS